MFTVFEWRQTPCAECDAAENGLHNRADHGCLVEVEVAQHRAFFTARMHAGRIAKKGVAVTVYDREFSDAVFSI